MLAGVHGVQPKGTSGEIRATDVRLFSICHFAGVVSNQKEFRGGGGGGDMCHGCSAIVDMSCAPSFAIFHLPFCTLKDYATPHCRAKICKPFAQKGHGIFLKGIDMT